MTENRALLTKLCRCTYHSLRLHGLSCQLPHCFSTNHGTQFLFCVSVCGPVVASGMGYSWQVALGANLISCTLFVILSFFELRALITSIIPDSLKHAIAVRIGLLIALVEFEYGGIVVYTPGTLLGTTTITSYIESTAGIQAGGRTGLSNIITACLLLLSLLFYPLIKMAGGSYQTPGGNYLYPVIAPSLIIIGSMMIFKLL